MSILLGLDERGKPCAANEFKVFLLKSFLDVLKDSFRDKKFTLRISNEPVPEQSLQLWRKRGFEPATIGCAFVKFDNVDKEYTYPAYMWAA